MDKNILKAKQKVLQSERAVIARNTLTEVPVDSPGYMAIDEVP